MNLTEKDFSETLSVLTDFKPDSKILIAFSGGADSLALAILTAKALGTENTLAVYVDHKIRTQQELEEEKKLNRSNCLKAGIQYIEIELNKKELEELAKTSGTEAAARKLRYRELEKAADENGFDYIATAHHFDDQIETILMKVMSNAPVPSLRGIADKKGRVIRPLLEYRKSELKNYLIEKGYKWSTDSTNSDNNILRNEIRNIIIPQLSGFIPDYEKRLLNLRSAAFRLEKQSNQDSVFNLFSMWDKLFDTEMPQTLVKRVQDAFKAGKTQIISANAGTFCIFNGKIILVDESENSSYSSFCLALDQLKKSDKKENEIIYNLKDCKELVITKFKRFTTDLKIDFSLIENPAVRYSKPGDRIKLKDGEKMVLRLLQDNKIAPVLRNRVPVVVDGDEVVAVLGSVFGGRDRLCRRLLETAGCKSDSLLADLNYYVYIK